MNTVMKRTRCAHTNRLVFTSDLSPIILRLFVLLSLLGAAQATTLQAEDVPAGKTGLLQPELDKVLAPIALYPDALLSQVLMASTYEDQISEAYAWTQKNPDAKGDAAVKQVQDKGWDASVASLVAFPEVLNRLNRDKTSLQKLGTAFLNDPKTVMDTIQMLRKKAKEQGSLVSNEQQTVTVNSATSQTPEIIVISSVQPEVVYVPVYDPTIVYGTWWWPYYPPPVYYPPPPSYSYARAFVKGVAFGLGIAITHSLWSDCDWRRRDININVNKFNSINVNKLNVNKKDLSWNQSDLRQKCIRDHQSRTFNKRGAQKGPASREAYRGRAGNFDPSKRPNTPNRDLDRDKARQVMQSKGIDPAQGRQALQKDSAQIRQDLQRRNQEMIRNKQFYTRPSPSYRAPHALDNIGQSQMNRYSERGRSSIQRRSYSRPSPAIQRSRSAAPAMRSGGGFRRR